jgi:hypothetical protein
MDSQDLRRLRVFLSYSSGDRPAARELFAYLSSVGVDPWLDIEKLLPGQEWESEIKAAVRNSDAVIVCLSHGSATKEGYVQKEIRLALDVADEKPQGMIFVIPIRLEECQVPDRLRKWQWVDAFDQDDRPFERLLGALVLRAEMSSSIRLPEYSKLDTEVPPFKYFYYISRPKIDMIRAQLGVTPQISLIGNIPQGALEVTKTA